MNATPPFIDDYLAYLLARASHHISSEFHAEVRAKGLSTMEWRVMASLSPDKTLGVSALADRVLAQQPTVTKLVARMVEQGWVMRRPSPQDKRQALIQLTAKGRHAVAPLLERAKAHERQTLARLAPGDGEQLKMVLQQLISLQNDTP